VRAADYPLPRSSQGALPEYRGNFLTAWRADWPAISAHNEDRETESGWLGI